MPHVPIKIHVIIENAPTKAFSTKLTSTVAILVGYHAFLFENSK